MLKRNRFLRNILLIIAPFTIMIAINEFERPKIKNNSYSYNGFSTINPGGPNTQICTWSCHNKTVSHCKTKHVKFLKPFYKVTDIPYDFVIHRLRDTGNYDLANIIFLVLLFPFTIIYFLIKSLNLQDEINKLSEQK
jgi:hypothetical protein